MGCCFIKRGSKRTKPIYDGIQFDSKAEVRDYKYIMEHPNIEIIEFEPFFLLEEPFTYFCLEKGKERKYGKFSYKADFLLKVEGLDKLVVWETKGRPKPDYMIRKKLWYKKYGDEYYFVQIHSSKQSKEIFDKYKEEL